MEVIFLVKVEKRSGEMEEFDRNKLWNSLKNAGANDDQAERVTSRVEGRMRDGISTDDIREWVILELVAYPDVADNYQSFRKEVIARH